MLFNKNKRIFFKTNYNANNGFHSTFCCWKIHFLFLKDVIQLLTFNMHKRFIVYDEIRTLFHNINEYYVTYTHLRVFQKKNMLKGMHSSIQSLFGSNSLLEKLKKSDQRYRTNKETEVAGQNQVIVYGIDNKWLQFSEKCCYNIVDWICWDFHISSFYFYNREHRLREWEWE